MMMMMMMMIRNGIRRAKLWRSRLAIPDALMPRLKRSLNTDSVITEHWSH